MREHRGAWSAAAGVWVVVFFTFAATWWNAAVADQSTLERWPAAVFAAAAVGGCYFIAAPLRDWWPWNPSRVRKRSAAAVLPELKRLHAAGRDLNTGPPSLHDQSDYIRRVARWRAQVVFTLTAQQPGLAAQFGSYEHHGEASVVMRLRHELLGQMIAELEEEAGVEAPDT